jgi:transposase
MRLAMKAMKGMKAMKSKGPSGAQFDRFTRGRIIGLAEAGMKTIAICERVRKTDKKHPKPDAVRKTIYKHKTTKDWRGERKAGSGRPPILSVATKKKIVELVIEERGSKVVTIGFVKRRILVVRKVSDDTVSRALHEAGLAYLRRRKEHLVPKTHIEPRLSFSRWLLRQPVEDIARFAFIDGTCYYLALSQTQAEDKERGRLGQHVWRDAEGKDGLFTDCIGASLYAAKQGLPVKVWGLLMNGHLCICVLPEDPTTKSGTAHMNGPRFQAMMDRYGKKWLRECNDGKLPHCVSLIQDYEKCLWTKDSIACLRAHHMRPLENYPASSQDLNVIECVWAHLRVRLNKSAPTGIEGRAAFIDRLRRAVRSLNADGSSTLQALCRSMPERCRAVLYRKGGRTDY